MENDNSSDPLPTEDSDSSETDSDLINYCVRIHNYNKFTFEELEDHFSQEPEIFRYVIGQEDTDKESEHYHLVLSVDSSVTETDVRDIIKAFLIPLWQTDKNKLPKGFGNKQYNLQITETIDEAIAYAIKEKKYVFEGFDPEYIKERENNSFKKKKRSDFKTELQDLRTKFNETDMDVREFMIEYTLLKAKFDQQVRMIDVYGTALSAEIKRNPSKAEDYVENFLYKQ